MVLYIYSVFLMCKGRFLSYAVYHFSCIEVYKRPDDGLQLELKYVATNKQIKLVFCVADLKHTLVIC
jgi:6-phosphogluconolactonase (cycloisomerase 2 family)